MAKVINTGDFTEVETEFVHAPVGLYHGKVVEITQKPSSNDEPMVEVRWQLVKDADGKKLKKNYANLWYYAPIDPDASWARRMKELLVAFGLKVKGDNVAKIEGKEALLRLKEGTDLEGEYRPNISKILKAGSVEPTDEEDEEPEDAEDEEEEEVEYDDLSLAELKEELEERGLPTKGKKAALIARLEEDDESEDEDEDEDEEPEAEAEEDEDEVDLDSMDRKELKAFIKSEELDVKVTPKMDEDDIRQAIEEQLEEAEDEDEEEEPEDEADEDEDEEDNYDDMAVAELKQELEDRELKADGTKKVLIARLRKDDEVPV